MYDAKIPLFELAQEAFPLVGNKALKLARETQNTDFGELGTRLLVFSLAEGAINSDHHAKVYESKLQTIVEMLESICAWPHCNTKKSEGYPNLGNLVNCKRVGGNQDHFDIRPGLRRIIETRRFKDLLAILGETENLTTSLSSADLRLATFQTTKDDPGYPPFVNEALHATIDLHTNCNCEKQHLKVTRLRLDKAIKNEDIDIPFDMLLQQSSNKDGSRNQEGEAWYKTKINVRSKRISRKQASASLRSWNKNNHELSESGSLSLGQLCNYLASVMVIYSQFKLTVEDSIPKLWPDIKQIDTSEEGKPIATNSLSLAELLRRAGKKMSIKQRLHLAYILVKSVWQYYGTDWMKSPWTHHDIQFLEESTETGKGDSGGSISVYHPYLGHDFGKQDTAIGEYCSDGILFHRYPRVLSLAIMLIEIIRGLPFGEGEHLQPYNHLKIKKYTSFAWNAVFKKSLGCRHDCNQDCGNICGHDCSVDCNIDGSLGNKTAQACYKEVLRKCLDQTLFQTAEYDRTDPQKDLEVRKTIIYREIVYPLERLLADSDAYDSPELQKMDFGELKSVDSNEISHRNRRENEVFGRHKQQVNVTAVQTTNVARFTEARTVHFRDEDRTISPDHDTRHIRPTSRDDFEIAIICALPLEYDAIDLLVDEYWDEDVDYGRAPGDQNIYRTGRIGNHNVVLALLPGMGKVNAASVAVHFQSSYAKLQLALLVGICGGVPIDGERGTEILLGDVIISQSVVQYDFGRKYPDGFRPKTGLQSDIGRANHDVRGFLQLLITRNIRMRLQARTLHHLKTLQSKVEDGTYDYPGVAEDKLFHASYRHRHHTFLDCEICNQCTRKEHPVCEKALELACTDLQCDESQLVRRKRLEKKAEALMNGHAIEDIQKPVVHFGAVGCADTVMKSGEDRDENARNDKVIAFEMEGAGVWNNLSCIIFKGVCDYADSHKNKKWQNFAAATAASAVKAALERYNRRDSRNPNRH